MAPVSRAGHVTQGARSQVDKLILKCLMVKMSTLSMSNPKITRRIWRYVLANFDRAAELLDTIEWANLLPDSVDAFGRPGRLIFYK